MEINEIRQRALEIMDMSGPDPENEAVFKELYLYVSVVKDIANGNDPVEPIVKARALLDGLGVEY